MDKKQEIMIREKIVELIDAFVNKEIGEQLDKNKLARTIEQRITAIPADHFLTRAMIRRAKWDARNLECNYRCFICHREHDKKEDFVKDLENHILDFYAGIPLEVAGDFLKRLKSKIPEEQHAKIIDRMYREVKNEK